MAQHWLAALSAGRLHDAAEVMTPTALYNLIPRPSAPSAAPPEFSLEKAIGWLRSDSLVLAIQSGDGDDEVQFHRQQATFSWTGRLPEVASQFLATGAGQDEVELVVMLSRTENPDGQIAWLVKDWKLLERDPGGL